MIALARAGVMAAAVVTTACGATLMKLPAGPGAPAPDAGVALEQATTFCNTIGSMTAEASVSGRVGGERLRARLLLGVAAPDRARIEALAFGQLIFTFVARDGDATLILNRDGRVLQHGRPEEVLEAITGAPLDGPRLRTTLTGCAPAAETVDGRQLGEHWRVVSTAGTDLYLQRESGTAPWRLVAAVHRRAGQPGWRAEYREFVSGLPHDVRLASADRDRFTLQIRLTDPELNVVLGPEAFEVNIPSSAAPISIDELRASGPLASRNDR